MSLARQTHCDSKFIEPIVNFAEKAMKHFQLSYELIRNTILYCINLWSILNMTKQQLIDSSRGKKSNFGGDSDIRHLLY